MILGYNTSFILNMTFIKNEIKRSNLFFRRHLVVLNSLKGMISSGHQNMAFLEKRRVIFGTCRARDKRLAESIINGCSRMQLILLLMDDENL